jgi:hypothetical protein
MRRYIQPDHLGIARALYQLISKAESEEELHLIKEITGFFYDHYREDSDRIFFDLDEWVDLKLESDVITKKAMARRWANSIVKDFPELELG